METGDESRAKPFEGSVLARKKERTFPPRSSVGGQCRRFLPQNDETGAPGRSLVKRLGIHAPPRIALRERGLPTPRTETRFSFGDDESELGDYAWFRDNAWNADERYAHRVGQKKANPWGLHDMHGNVWEWCRDVYAEKLPGGRDPDVKSEENIKVSSRVFRGGSWGFDAARCRSGERNSGQPGYRYCDRGFRVALSSVQ